MKSQAAQVIGDIAQREKFDVVLNRQAVIIADKASTSPIRVLAQMNKSAAGNGPAATAAAPEAPHAHAGARRRQGLLDQPAGRTITPFMLSRPKRSSGRDNA